MERQPCLSKGCRASFEGRPARDGEVRHCNKSGPDGGHVHHWDGKAWQSDAGMQHDRR
jgi:hypothetical protein